MLRRTMMAGGEAISNVEFDPLQTHSAITLSSGNLVATGNNNSGGHSKSLVSHSSGKWYLEVDLVSFQSVGSGSVGMVGVVLASTPIANIVGVGAGTSGLYALKNSNLRQTYFEGAASELPGGFTPNGAIAMMAWDADNGRIWFGLDGSWFGTGNPSAGTDPRYTSASLTGAHHFAVCPRNSGNQLRARVSPAYSIPSGFTYW